MDRDRDEDKIGASHEHVVTEGGGKPIPALSHKEIPVGGGSQEGHCPSRPPDQPTKSVSLSLPKEEDSSTPDSSPEPHLSVADTAASTTPSSGTGSAVGVGSPVRAHLVAGKVSENPSGTSAPAPSSTQVGSASQEEWISSEFVRSSSATTDESNLVQPATERSSSSTSFAAAVKLLVSNNVAGSIIGRSGQTISELQAQSSTRIKLSQAGDYYPGTQDRVCLVQGDAENVKIATSLILTRLHSLQQQQHSHHYPSWQQDSELIGDSNVGSGMLGGAEPVEAGGSTSMSSFSFVVKLLVPTPCCGMLIGKGGSNIKQMVEDSGVSSIRLAPKQGGSTDFAPGSTTAAAAAAMVSATAERVVTITGPDLNCCIKCMSMILDGMTAHPDICRYANMTTSYSRVLSAAHGALGAAQAAALAAARASVVAGPPSAATPTRPSSSPDSIPAPTMSHGIDAATVGLWDPQITPGSVGGGFASSSQSVFAAAPTSSGAAIPQQRTDLAGYSPVFGRPASSTPGSYLPASPTDNPPSTFQPSPSTSRPIQTPSYLVPPSSASGQHQHTSTALWMVGGVDNSAQGSSAAVSGSTSAPDLLALQLQDSARLSDLHPPPLLPTGMMDSTTGAQPPGPPAAASTTPPQQRQGFTAQVAIPDSLIGSILGRGGRTLNDLQVLSNTRIRISQRGEFVPGTKNRIVTIRGPTAQSVASAQFLMSQRMVLPPTAVLGGGTSSPGAPGSVVVPLQPITPEQQRGSAATLSPSPQREQQPQQPQSSTHIHSTLHSSSTTPPRHHEEHAPSST